MSSVYTQCLIIIIIILYVYNIAETILIIIILCLILIKEKKLLHCRATLHRAYDLSKPVCVHGYVKMFYLKTDSLLSSLNPVISFVCMYVVCIYIVVGCRIMLYTNCICSIYMIIVVHVCVCNNQCTGVLFERTFL